MGAAPFLRAGGGAGGGPRRDAAVLPVFCGLSLLPGGAPGGGGGGALGFASLAVDSLAFFCSMYILIKSAFCSI